MNIKSKTFIEYFNEYNKIKGMQNVQDTINAAKNREKWLITKLENHVKRFSIGDVESYLQKIIEDPMMASWASKNPQNQNTAEHTQLGFLTANNISVKNLSNSALKLEGFLKTIDFMINEEWHTIAKVTNQMGGHQSNVIDEIKHTINAASNSHYDKKFIFLLDGSTWSESLMNELKEFETNRIIITNSDGLLNKEL